MDVLSRYRRQQCPIPWFLITAHVEKSATAIQNMMKVSASVAMYL